MKIAIGISFLFASILSSVFIAAPTFAWESPHWNKHVTTHTYRGSCSLVRSRAGCKTEYKATGSVTKTPVCICK